MQVELLLLHDSVSLLLDELAEYLVFWSAAVPSFVGLVRQLIQLAIGLRVDLIEDVTHRAYKRDRGEPRQPPTPEIRFLFKQLKSEAAIAENFPCLDRHRSICRGSDEAQSLLAITRHAGCVHFLEIVDQIETVTERRFAKGDYLFQLGNRNSIARRIVELKIFQ
jgi:hypothetical protein